MPGPNPHELWIDDDDPARPAVSFQNYSWTNNSGNRKARAISILRRLQLKDWACRWCGDPLPEYKRADALYCGESCRKRSARARLASDLGSGFQNKCSQKIP